MVFPELWWVLLIVSAVLCSVGFYKFVYFLSVGYGLAVAGCGIAIAIMSIVNGVYIIPVLIQCVLFVIYGGRLSLFLIVREIKNAAYRKTLYSQTETKPMPIFVKATIWISVAALYPCQVSPVFYNISNGIVVDIFGSVWMWVGVVIMILGLIIESVADAQKSAQKKENPHMVATKGLYKMCRCPNYFGEILFWTGVFVSGIQSVSGLQWIITAFGYICIVYIMFNGAQRLEKRQNGNYGTNPEYIEYTSKTPIIIPLLPIYHLVKNSDKEKK